MTSSAETQPRDSHPESPLGRAWRERMARAQEAGLPGGRVRVSCSAPLASGGLGRHLQEILDALARAQRSSGASAHRRARRRRAPRHARRGTAWAPPTWPTCSPRCPFGTGLPCATHARVHARFDAYAARQPTRAANLIAFNGQALTQFDTARRSGFESCSLVSANSHLRQVARQHARAHRQYPLEGSWSTHLIERNLAEYARADRIYVSSRYVRESFLSEGFREEKLVDFPLTPDPATSPDTRHANRTRSTSSTWGASRSTRGYRC